MEWVDDVRELRVRVNADSAGQAAEAAELGAEGIGLCRTENILYNDGKMPMLKEMLLTQDAAKRKEMLQELKE